MPGSFLPQRCTAIDGTAQAVLHMILIARQSRFHRGHTLANETGKRYYCGTCGSEFIVTKGGDGTVSCHGEPLVKK